MDTTLTTPTASTARPVTDRTRHLLLGGVVAGPAYVTVSLAQALTRDGFDVLRHPWSLLAAGPGGWVQMANLVVTGALLLVFAVGISRTRPGRWAARLIGGFGIGMIASGVLVADPASGYPVGVAPEITWHGIGHMVAGAIGFACLIAATFVIARQQARAGRRAAAWVSRVVGLGFLATFAGISSGAPTPATTVPFVLAVVTAFAWITVLAVELRSR